MISENRLLVSYLTLRQFLGWMGITMPFVLVFFNWIFFRNDIATSLSAFYHVKYVGALFVGVLCAFGVFLIAYKGYPLYATDKWHEFSDNTVTNFAGVFAIGVAFFPASPANPSDLDTIFAVVHFASAALFLAALAYLAFFLFTKTYPAAEPHPVVDAELRAAEGRQKRFRDWVYRICGIVIVLCIVLIGVNSLLGDVLESIKPVFWLESIAIITFGFSWLVKGQVLLKDPR